MRGIAWRLAVLALVLGTGAPVLSAQQQSFQGTGQEATGLFPLDEGLSVFEVEHRGEGPFTVRLLDEQGGLVDVLGRGNGRFLGSKAVRIPQTGRYLLDVEAGGAWSVRRRTLDEAAVAASTMPDSTSPVYRAAMEAAGQVPTNRWLAGGFLGGALGGPIGAAVAVGVAGRSGVPAPAFDDGGPGSEPGYEAAFSARVRELRRRKAFIGGMVGTGVFLAGLIWALDIASDGGGAPGTDPGGGGGEFILVPR